MYFKLKEHCFFFESIFDLKSNYFNVDDYKIYSQDERQELMNNGVFQKESFLLIPQIDRDEIVAEYLILKNNRRLLRQKNDKDFFMKFHFYTEGNRLVEEWNDFEEAKLIQFGSEWCEENQIKFTAGQ